MPIYDDESIEKSNEKENELRRAIKGGASIEEAMRILPPEKW